jgi:NTP pyrophosphatase (non-canonical NTP hydrolase)
MLVNTELCEAAEAARHKDYENFREEIADTFIRLLDLTGTMGINIEQEIVKKMITNEARPHKHGKHA